MNLQFVIDGLISGSMVGLGAIGITLTYSILRFSNFAHGDLMAWGTYFTLMLATAIGAFFGQVAPIGPLSFGWPLIIGVFLAMGCTALLALFIDAVLFSRLRAKGQVVVMVMASFGASMSLRSLLEFIFTSSPTYFTRAIQIAFPIGLGVRVTPDEVAMLVAVVVLVVIVHLVLTRTQTGRSMQAVSQNVALARVTGIDVTRVVRTTWIVGATLACFAGVMAGVLIQIRPLMGMDMTLPMFAAAILGGVGSVPGALLGGIIIGLAEAGAVQLVGAEWRLGVAFIVLFGVLLVRPIGLFGVEER